MRLITIVIVVSIICCFYNIFTSLFFLIYTWILPFCIHLYQYCYPKNKNSLRNFQFYWIIYSIFRFLNSALESNLRVIPGYYVLIICLFVTLWHPQSNYSLKIFQKFVIPILEKFMLSNEEVEHVNNVNLLCSSHIF